MSEPRQPDIITKLQTPPALPHSCLIPFNRPFLPRLPPGHLLKSLLEIRRPPAGRHSQIKHVKVDIKLWPKIEIAIPSRIDSVDITKNTLSTFERMHAS